MNTPIFPIDFNLIRKSLCDEVELITGLKCILAEPENALDKRPNLPYFTVKLTMPAQKVGDDSYSARGDSSTNWDFGATRRCTAEFVCYAKTHETAYNYMSLWQGSLDTIPVQQDLRVGGIAVWQILNNTDTTLLLNTGFEGRAMLECYFGIVSNITKDLGEITSVPVQGEVFSDSGTNEVSYTITEE